MTITEDERNEIKKQGALESDVNTLKDTVPRIFSELKSINKSVSAMPLEMVSCQRRIESQLKKYVHAEFALKTEVQKMDKDITTEVASVNRKLSQQDKKMAVYAAIISGFISAGVFAIWLLVSAEELHNML